MPDLIVPHIICFQTQNQLAALSSIQVLLKSALIDLRVGNFVHAKTSLRARCMLARHSLSNPAPKLKICIHQCQ